MQEVVRVAHRLSARVEFLGGRRNAARNAFYGEIDLFVMPSRFKPFGSTLLEAVWH
ncbi:Glycosyl transferases group 1 [Arboricoccus pini]|uniref:Glycosyl transferases group 1 n=1 Tax=Arboricoccus pini TaxID=1963835 RepID=A0A212R400_9PROT|nr:glycosyltransferase [Arboricoccus pini]SNB66548.1 Glycosyl transferases group 1 [Arboricoccus pini]